MICQAYGTGDPDLREPGGYLKVQWKQFAIDFDNIPDTDDDSRSPMEPYRRACSSRRGDAAAPSTSPTPSRSTPAAGSTTTRG